MKVRPCSDGLLLFERCTGQYVLIDEVSFAEVDWALGPRQVSIALTNRCDLACPHCYAPKSAHELPLSLLKQWALELDQLGTFGVGFGGGEPLLHPDLVELLAYIRNKTRMATSLTTHGHHFTEAMIDRCAGLLDCVRVSMDGVGTTYESLRKRSFDQLTDIVRSLVEVFYVGINMVVNRQTIDELDLVANHANDLGARELLLLPQVGLKGALAINGDDEDRLMRWIRSYRGPLRLSIGENIEHHFPEANPLLSESPTFRYAHISAQGFLKSSSYDEHGLALFGKDLFNVLNQFHKKEGYC